MADRVLTLRDLNRALLARQMLLERARLDAVGAVERLGALQAQWPRAPYLALWSRLARFERTDLEAPAFDEAVLHTVVRHLAAFGPATVDDVASWTSLRTPPIRAAIARLRGRVRTFRDERGRTLYDLARAPRPSPDLAAPPRFLPKWDSTLLAYSPPERVRILSEPHRKAVIGKNGDVAQTILVDGMVGGTWRVAERGRGTVVEVTPFRPLGRADRAALVDEGERLARFLAPEARSHGVRL